MKLRAMYCGVGLAVGMGVTAPAVAGSDVTLLFDDFTGGYAHVAGHGWGGAGAFDTDQISGGGGLAESLLTFCIEVPQNIHLDKAYHYNLTQLANAPNPGSPDSWQAMGSVKQDRLERWFGAHYDNLGGDAIGLWQADEALAFQAGIWEIVREDTLAGYSVTSGAFAITAYKSRGFGAWPSGLQNPLTLADAWLAAMDWNDPEAKLLELVAFTNDTLQDHVTVVPSPTAVMAAAPMLGLLLTRRRRVTRRA